MKEMTELQAEDFDWCWGITSEVAIDSVLQGHLLMLDLDDTKLSRVRQIVDHLPDGLYVILRSSENSYNVVSLNYMSWTKVVEEKAQVYEDDSRHLKIGIQRDSWVTRVSEKGEKSMPELVEVFEVGRFTTENYSRAHVEFFSELYSERDFYSMLPAVENVNPTSLTRIKYPTRSERQDEGGEA